MQQVRCTGLRGMGQVDGGEQGVRRVLTQRVRGSEGGCQPWVVASKGSVVARVVALEAVRRSRGHSTSAVLVGVSCAWAPASHTNRSNGLAMRRLGER